MEKDTDINEAYDNWIKEKIHEMQNCVKLIPHWYHTQEDGDSVTTWLGSCASFEDFEFRDDYEFFLDYDYDINTGLVDAYIFFEECEVYLSIPRWRADKLNKYIEEVE